MGYQLAVGVFDKSVCDDAEFDDLQPLCVLPPVVRFEVPNNDFPFSMNQVVLLLKIQR
jgi:hypothetical protein